MVSPRASFTDSASHVPEKMALTLPSRKPAIPAPSASLMKFGFLQRSTRYSVTAAALSPLKSTPAAASVPSPNNVHPFAT